MNSINLKFAETDSKLNQMSAEQIVYWAADTFKAGLVMSTSFGIQSAIMLHLVTKIIPKIPVIWVDTGYLHPETYEFAEYLTQRLQLNLKVYKSSISPDEMEYIYGKLWERNDVESLNLYDKIRKVEPMQRALRELNATAWLSGLRRSQTDYRMNLDRVNLQEQMYKILPIIDWSDRDVYQYLKSNDLPYHPLFNQGYLTVGDWHSSRPISADDLHERDTRFQGLKQECGLHLPQASYSVA
ncbi:MAG: phosphoadenylyl-sulfate reductase [Microcoleaceae cyanobacterium]